MHRFHPTRASPPIPLSSFGSVTSTETTFLLPPELQNLSSEDLDCLDSIIRRAGPNATSFLPIFKAYSEVLKERGLDSQEVVYYGKLLKLGTLKGGNFLDKWEMVKATQQNMHTQTTFLVGESEASNETIPAIKPSVNDPALTRLARLQEIRKVHSKIQLESKETHAVAPKARSTLVQKVRPHHVHHEPVTRVPVSAKGLLVPGKPLPSVSLFVSSDEEPGSASTKPPSYKSAVAAPMIMSKRREITTRNSDQVGGPLPFKQEINHQLQGHSNRKPIDPNEAWKNIEMEQNEEKADSFHNNVLLFRYWGIWVHGYNWIITTNDQMGKARDKVVLDLFMRRWRQRLVTRIDQQNLLLSKFNRQRMLSVMSFWREKLKQKQQVAWRNEMRRKMKVVRSKTDARIKRQALHQWHRLFITHNADRHYQQTLLTQYLTQWKIKLSTISSLQSTSNTFTEDLKLKTLHRLWSVWKRSLMLRRDEVEFTRKINRRFFAKYFDAWRARMELSAVADAFRDKAIQRNATASWKRALIHHQVLDQKVAKHLNKQDDILFRAIIRIWRARMRGLRLEKLRNGTMLKRYFTIWKFALDKQRARFEQAQAFNGRHQGQLAISSMKKWQEAMNRHQTYCLHAEQYDRVRLLASATLTWRMGLRDHIQNMKMAKWAQRFFATRRAWRVWIAAMEERKRQKTLQGWNQGITRKSFMQWRRRTAEKQYFEECERALRQSIDKRVLAHALTKWTNRVIDLKSRELDVAQTFDRTVMRAAFDKWKAAQSRRIEDRSLLDNYLILKDRDLLTKLFRLWLGKQRSAEQRREEHELKEKQLREVLMLSAWEKWRERYKEEVLRPLEYDHIFRSQRATQMKAFVSWHGKTKTLPAIHFHAQKTREIFYKRWKEAMPKVLKIKRAKEIDRQNTLGRYLEKWKQAHKTKLTLKAVARAKYLRLPPSSRAQLPGPIRSSRPIYSAPVPRGTISRTYQLHTEHEESETEDNTEHPLAPSPSLLLPLARHQVSAPRWTTRISRNASRSPVRSEYTTPFTPVAGLRDPSPVRSIASMPDRRISRSRASSRAESFVSSSRVGVTGPREDRLWSAIKEFGQSRSKGA